jgi:sugar-specific transcriptional regulator TrmB
LKITEKEDANRLSREWLEKTLINLGFTAIDVDVYIHLTREGPRKISEIAPALKLHTRRLYRILKRLQSKGIVEISKEYADSFSAVPFEKVLDLLIKANLEEAKSLIKNEKDLLSSWRSITEKYDEKS